MQLVNLCTRSGTMKQVFHVAAALDICTLQCYYDVAIVFVCYAMYVRACVRACARARVRACIRYKFSTQHLPSRHTTFTRHLHNREGRSSSSLWCAYYPWHITYAMCCIPFVHQISCLRRSVFGNAEMRPCSNFKKNFQEMTIINCPTPGRINVYTYRHILLMYKLQ